MKKKKTAPKKETVKESDLYPCVAEYFTQMGFTVKGEVKGCDVVAIKDEQMTIIELKKVFNVKLLYQCTRRLALTDLVYAATLIPKKSASVSQWTLMRSLCRRLHIGLLLVDLDSKKVKLVCEPGDFAGRKNPRSGLKVVKEFAGRKVAVNEGGTTGVKLETAYLETSIQIAVLLSQNPRSSAGQLVKLGSDAVKTSRILQNNYYHWFEKIERGKYSLKKGQALKIQKLYPKIWEFYSRQTKLDTKE